MVIGVDGPHVHGKGLAQEVCRGIIVSSLEAGRLVVVCIAEYVSFGASNSSTHADVSMQMGTCSWQVWLRQKGSRPGVLSWYIIFMNR